MPGDSSESPLDPAAAEDQVVLIDGHDLAGSDGGLRGLEADASAAVGEGFDGRRHGAVLGADLGQAGDRAGRLGPLPVEPRGDQAGLLERLAPADGDGPASIGSISTT